MGCWLWAHLYLVTSWNASAMKSFHSSSSSLAISSPIHWQKATHGLEASCSVVCRRSWMAMFSIIPHMFHQR